MDFPLRFLLSAFGSGGDVMPLLSLGQTLRERGHRVTVLTGGGFADIAERCGLECLPVLSPGLYEESLRDVHLLGSRHHSLFFKRYAVDWNIELLKIASGVSPRNTVLLSTDRPMIWADLAAHRHHGLTCARIVVEPPPAPGTGSSAGAAGAKPSPRLAEAWQKDWRQGARGLGVSAGHNHVARLTRATFRSVPRLAVWPKWLAPDTPLGAQVQKFGFVGGPRFQDDAGIDRHGSVQPLLVFMAGSVGTTHRWDREFAQTAREICRRLGCDGLMLGGSPASDFQDTADFAWRKHLPLDAVLPSAAAIVHHGGIGTAATALEHGVPQLIVPRLFSQPSNAEWLRRLGVAQVVQPADFNAEEGVRAISALVRNGCRETSRSVGARIDPAADRNRICSFVEELHRMRVFPESNAGVSRPARRSLPISPAAGAAARFPELVLSTG